MDIYTFLRQLADSWELLAMMTFYITACLWAFRPSARRSNEEAAGIPFRNDEAGDDLQSEEVEAK